MGVSVTHNPARTNIPARNADFRNGFFKSINARGADIFNAQTYAFRPSGQANPSTSLTYNGSTAYDISIECPDKCTCRIDVSLEASADVKADTSWTWLDSLSDGDVIAAVKAKVDSSLSGKTAQAAAQSGDGAPVPFLAVKGVTVQIKKGQGPQPDADNLTDQKSFNACNARVAVSSSASLVSRIWFIAGGDANAEAETTHTVVIRGYCRCKGRENRVLNEKYTDGILVERNGQPVTVSSSERAAAPNERLARAVAARDNVAISRELLPTDRAEIERCLRASGASDDVVSAALVQLDAEAASPIVDGIQNAAGGPEFLRYVARIRKLLDETLMDDTP